MGRKWVIRSVESGLWGRSTLLAVSLLPETRTFILGFVLFLDAFLIKRMVVI